MLDELALTSYAGQREQFGRPIGRFQAIQQQVALMAAEVATSRAAAVIARIAHQVHGALGFTLEHPLRLATTRLWSWRDECGNEAAWQAEIGRAALDAGSDGLWPLVTGTS